MKYGAPPLFRGGAERRAVLYAGFCLTVASRRPWRRPSI